MNGCPVGAYEKEEDTGIVRHLDDQCIGCEYCVLKCPYDVPKYSHDRGIVRKCDMCHQRLADGEAPACVQACPHRSDFPSSRSILPPSVHKIIFLPGAPRFLHHQSHHPATSAVMSPADVKPADQSQLRPQPAHWPLALMLTLTQIGLGISSSSLFTSTDEVGALNIVGFPHLQCRHDRRHPPPRKTPQSLALLPRSQKPPGSHREILAFSLLAPIPALSRRTHLSPRFPLQGTHQHRRKTLPHPPRPRRHLHQRHDLPRHQAGQLAILPNPSRLLPDFRLRSLSLHPPRPSFSSSPSSPSATKPSPSSPPVQKPGPRINTAPSSASAPSVASPAPRFLAGVIAIPFAFISPWLALPFLLTSELLSRHLFFRAVYAPQDARRPQLTIPFSHHRKIVTIFRVLNHGSSRAHLI